ncbi:methylated-DNA--[protein]-cysteine S-methyltransferase [Undibacterium rugosum]|uniref:methylated-DNA--[protein]-cysteine S-methyltransferase n=1 Tax=Undibacterium rugosum TaxID=2762291 RepID=UPI001B821764|nr:methylated-DNA--[protein]-cysteine S-methyltransferase [Undibacterium rugosum]MBR7779196.1 methylated-DNA--[protein]-cysteine S-methyltransferase [Undibacterium rugosum]
MTKAESELFDSIVRAPFGAVGIRTANDLLSELVYLPARFEEKAPSDALNLQIHQQLLAYFDDPHFRFSLPLQPRGSEFQNRVWRAIAAIPCGSVLTYGEVARQIRSAPRAVGQACGANWYPLVIPCHRVTAATGLGGFAHHDDESGFHLGVKRWLLAHEGLTQYGT